MFTKMMIMISGGPSLCLTALKKMLLPLTKNSESRLTSKREDTMDPYMSDP